MTILTIGILSLPSRQFTTLPKLLQVLEPQIVGKPVQLIILTDNKSMTVGKKRQHVTDMAAGKYISCVDDDDMVTPDYVDQLLKAAESNADCLTFRVLVQERVYEKVCKYSINFYNTITSTEYLRKPNHICAIKTELARKVTWPDVTGPEDVQWADLLHPLLKTETEITKVLYYYSVNKQTTEGQPRVDNGNNRPIDMVILSYAKTPELRKTTETCLRSLFTSEIRAEDLFNIFVIEGEPGITWDFPNTKTIKPPEPYGYNKYANFGRKLGSAEYVCICNNDLIFYENWARNMLHVADNFPWASSFSPVCPKSHGDKYPSDGRVHFGHVVREHVAGWCLFQRRAIYNVIGELDERFVHWYADDDYAQTLKSYNLHHGLVTGSIVQHVNGLVGATTAEKILNQEQLISLTHGQLKVFKDKWKL